MPHIIWLEWLSIFKVMHALGWWHEQQRPDRDAYVKLWPDHCLWNPSLWEIAFEVMDDWFDQDSPYDFASVMHYDTDSCARHTWQPVITKPDGSPLTLNKTSSLSEHDIWQINKIYNCELVSTPEPPTTTTIEPPVGRKFRFVPIVGHRLRLIVTKVHTFFNNKIKNVTKIGISKGSATIQYV